MRSASEPDRPKRSTAEVSDSLPERERGRGTGISREPGGTAAGLLGLQAATGASVRPASDNPCNVLVTGGAGYIGSHTSKALAQAGYTPVVIDDLSTGHRESVHWGPFIEGNIADRSLVSAVLRRYDIAAVIHFAGSALVGESMCDPGMYFRNNAAAGTALLDAMCAEGVKQIVFASSCATYGYPQSVPISETHPQVPANPYGESKLAVERQLRWFGEIHGLRYVALRYFNAAGADPEGELGEEHANETHIVPLVIQAILGKLPHFLILGDDYATPDGTAVRDYIHVSDLAAAHVKALAYLRDGRESVALNLGLGKGHSVRQVIDVAEAVTGRKVPWRLGPRRPGDPDVLVADASSARAALEWAPQFDLPEMIDCAWKWANTTRSKRLFSDDRDSIEQTLPTR